ncbi:MAG: T9SS type A sorting domain-containing protein, partial [Bacteroidales bacterium]
NIHLYLPQGSGLTDLIATFSLPLQAESYVFGVMQQSEVTPNNFTTPKIYNVEAGDGSLRDWLVIVQTTVGTDEFLTKSLEVFPNPVNDFLKVRNAHKATLQLYSVIGNRVFKTIIQGDDCRIDLGSLPEGIYFLRISASNDEFVRKLIISRGN